MDYLLGFYFNSGQAKLIITWIELRTELQTRGIDLLIELSERKQLSVFPNKQLFIQLTCTSLYLHLQTSTNCLLFQVSIHHHVLLHFYSTLFSIFITRHHHGKKIVR